MLGAVAFLGEKLIWQRWVAALLGFAGVMVVVAPGLSGAGGFYSLLMLASAPMFAASFLITKAMTRRDSPEVIVAWQSLTVSLFTLPAALWAWEWLSLRQWALVLLCGGLGTLGALPADHCLQAGRHQHRPAGEVLDLIWAAAWAYLFFAEVPDRPTLIGALVIFGATTWIARVEATAPAMSIAALDSAAQLERTPCGEGEHRLAALGRGHAAGAAAWRLGQLDALAAQHPGARRAIPRAGPGHTRPGGERHATWRGHARRCGAGAARRAGAAAGRKAALSPVRLLLRRPCGRAFGRAGGARVLSLILVGAASLGITRPPLDLLRVREKEGAERRRRIARTWLG
jgi:uncharacterized membrane protein